MTERAGNADPGDALRESIHGLCGELNGAVKSEAIQYLTRVVCRLDGNQVDDAFPASGSLEAAAAAAGLNASE